MAKNFFNSEKDRMLWVKLNAERIQYSNKILNNEDTPMGEIGTPYTCMQISLNQLEYDENNCDAPRFSLEELVVLLPNELFGLAKVRNIERIREIFESCRPTDFKF
jgi:hypothetical protein